jgi:hypothetical protein
MPFLEEREKPVEAHELDREQEAELEQAESTAAHEPIHTAQDALASPIAEVVRDIMSHWAEAEDAEPGLGPTHHVRPDVGVEDRPRFETGMAGDFVPDSAIGPSFGGGGGGGSGGSGGGGKPGDPFGEGEPPPKQPPK